MSIAAESLTMEKAVDFVHRMNMSPRDRALAEAYARELYEKKVAYAEGVAEGEANGKLAQIESAKLMLKAGKLQLSEVLSFFPVLTSQDVEKLRTEVSA